MNLFSAFEKSPRLTRAFRPFAPRRGGSHLSFVPRVRGPIVRVACCRFRHGPLAAGRFHACLVVFRFFVLAAASSFIFRSAVASVMLWRRPVPAAVRARRAWLVARLEGAALFMLLCSPQADTLKGASDSPNFGCPELSGEAVPDAEVVCPANFRALRVPHRGGLVLPFGQARRSLPSGRCSAFPAVACLPAASVCDGRLRLAVLGTCGGGLPSPPPLMGLCRIV